MSIEPDELVQTPFQILNEENGMITYRGGDFGLTKREKLIFDIYARYLETNSARMNSFFSAEVLGMYAEESIKAADILFKEMNEVDEL